MLDALAPIHGVKAHQTILVVFAHTVLVLHVGYILDDRNTDEILTSVAGVLVRNGSIVVQTFVTISYFLLAYTLLLQTDNTKKNIPLWNAPAIVLQRYLRLTPTVMFVVAVSATWVSRAGQGPMWTFMQQLEVDCRAKWWTHLLYINNLVNLDQICGIQTWFLAADFQVFLVLMPLTLLLLPDPRRAPKVLAVIYVGVLMANLTLNITWKIADSTYFTTADTLRTQLLGLESFNWMYITAWTSLPVGLHGVMLAFIHYNFQKSGFNPTDVKWIRVAAWSTFFVMMAWVWTGVFLEGVENRLVLAIHATLNRPIFNVVTFLLWTYFHKLSGWVPKYMSWRGFHILSRISLCTFLLHWVVHLGGQAARTQPVDYTRYAIFSWTLTNLATTVMLALLLHLLVELPMQRLAALLL